MYATAAPKANRPQQRSRLSFLRRVSSIAQFGAKATRSCARPGGIKYAETKRPAQTAVTMAMLTAAPMSHPSMLAPTGSKLPVKLLI